MSKSTTLARAVARTRAMVMRKPDDWPSESFAQGRDAASAIDMVLRA